MKVVFEACMRVRFRGPRLTRLTTKKGAAFTAPGCPRMFPYPPNSRAQNPFDRSASSSRRSSSALSLCVRPTAFFLDAGPLRLQILGRALRLGRQLQAALQAP